MSTMNSELLCQAIRRKLTYRAAGPAEAGAVAEATLSTWQQMAARLAPVLGEKGVNVLFGRALHLASISFPWLAIAGAHEGNAALLADLKACFATRDATAALAASDALLVTFTELLANLIGESLTERLLGPVWAPTLPADEQEDVS